MEILKIINPNTRAFESYSLDYFGYTINERDDELVVFAKSGGFSMVYKNPIVWGTERLGNLIVKEILATPKREV